MSSSSSGPRTRARPTSRPRPLGRTAAVAVPRRARARVGSVARRRRGHRASGPSWGDVPAQGLEARRLLPRSPILLPGVGAQGATPADVARAFTSGPASALVTASRSVIYAFRDSEDDWRSAAAAEAQRLSSRVGGLGLVTGSHDGLAARAQRSPPVQFPAGEAQGPARRRRPRGRVRDTRLGLGGDRRVDAGSPRSTPRPSTSWVATARCLRRAPGARKGDREHHQADDWPSSRSSAPRSRTRHRLATGGCGRRVDGLPARGEHLTVADLVRAMLIQSANDAAQALALHVGAGSTARFVAAMNTKAAEPGLADTRFANPHGLDAPTRLERPRRDARPVRARRPLHPGGARAQVGHAGGRPGVPGDQRPADELAAASRRKDRSHGGCGLVRGCGRQGARRDHPRNGAREREPRAERRPAHPPPLRARPLPPCGRRRREPRVRERRDRIRPTGRRARGAPADRAHPARGDGARRAVVAPGAVGLPVREGARLGRIEVYAGDRLVASSNLVAAESVSEPGLLRKLAWYAETTAENLWGLVS